MRANEASGGDPSSRARRRAATARFVTYARAHAWSFVAGAGLLLATNGLQTAIPWFLKDAIEAVRTHASRDALATAVGLLVAASLVQAVVRTLSRTVIYRAGREIEARLRGDLFAHLSRLSPSFYDRWRTGDIMSRATNDTSDVRMFLGAGFLQVVNTFFTYGTTVGMMLWLNPRLTLYAMVPYPVLLYVFNRLSKRMHDQSVAAQTELASLSSQIQESLSGVLLVKAYGREAHEAGAFERANRRYMEASLALGRTEGIAFPVVGAVGGMGTAILLALGGREVISGRITLGEFVAFNSYLGMLLWPTIGLGWILNVLERGLAAMGRLEELFEQEPAIVDSMEPLEVSSLSGELELRGLTFAYRPVAGAPPRTVLDGISAHLPKGSVCAVVGGTGSGKSTLVHLLARLYEVGEGQIFIDGHDVTRIPLATLRRSIAFVPQDNVLFGVSLGENIAYGLAEIDWERVRWAASVSRLEKDMAEFPQGFDTVVGERGVMLSGGQRQRTCIARALTREAPIVVIDDALSSVDTGTEEEILAGLKRWLAGRTALVISHRISTVKWADVIWVLDAGKLVEQGSHRQLIARGGLYARMAERQALSEALEGELEAA